MSPIGGGRASLRGLRLSTTTPTAAPDSAIHHYGYEDKFSSAAIDEVGDNDATIHALDYSSTAQVDDLSLEYAGIDDPWIEIPKPLDYSSGFSFTTWMYFSNASDRTTIAATRKDSNETGQFHFRQESQSINIGMPSGTNYSSSLSVSGEQYVFVGFAYDGAGGATFVVNDSTDIGTGTEFANFDDPLAVVGIINGGFTSGDGFVDYTSIHDTELSATELTDIYNNTA